MRDALQNIYKLLIYIILPYFAQDQVFFQNSYDFSTVINKNKKLQFQGRIMGNTKERSLTPFQQTIAVTSLIKTVHFSSKMEHDKFINQINHRMSIKSNNVPKIIYFQSLRELPYSVKLYFQYFGKPIKEIDQSIQTQCKCHEILKTIDQLHQRYGNFGINMNQVFVKYQGSHKSVCIWISPIVQKCQPVRIQSEQKMCHNIYQTLGKICGKANVYWQAKDGMKLYHFDNLVKQIQRMHKNMQENVIVWRQQTFSKADTKSIVAQSQYIDNIQMDQSQLEPLQIQPQQISINKVIIPKLNCRSIQSHSNNSGAQTQRIFVENHPEQDSPTLSSKDSLVLLTTARTPRKNYLIRNSSELTIFPNQYQQKFINKYRQKCKQQQSDRFQTFKRAMERYKPKTEPQQMQIFSFIFKGKGRKE